MNTESPIFLIAMPQLADPNFEKSVVLILNHNPSGALGLVVNKPADLNIGDFARLQDMDCHETIENIPIIRGGPVEPDRCWLLHTHDTIDEKQEISPGLYLSGTLESLQSFLKKGIKPIRIVIGYAGWAPGQLEQEIAEGAWLTCQVNKKHILQTEPVYVWKEVLSDMGVDPTHLVVGTGVH